MLFPSIFNCACYEHAKSQHWADVRLSLRLGPLSHLCELSNCPSSRETWEHEVWSAPPSAAEFKARDMLGGALAAFSQEDRIKILGDDLSQKAIVRAMLDAVPKPAMSVPNTANPAETERLRMLMHQWLAQAEAALPFLAISSDRVDVFENGEVVHVLGGDNAESWVNASPEQWIQEAASSVHTHSKSGAWRVRAQNGEIKIVDKESAEKMMPMQAGHYMGVVENEVQLNEALLKTPETAAWVAWKTGGMDSVLNSGTHLREVIMGAIQTWRMHQDSVVAAMEAGSAAHYPEKMSAITARTHHITEMFVGTHTTVPLNWAQRTAQCVDGMFLQEGRGVSVSEAAKTALDSILQPETREIVWSIFYPENQMLQEPIVSACNRLGITVSENAPGVLWERMLGKSSNDKTLAAFAQRCSNKVPISAGITCTATFPKQQNTAVIAPPMTEMRTGSCHHWQQSATGATGALVWSNPTPRWQRWDVAKSKDFTAQSVPMNHWLAASMQQEPLKHKFSVLWARKHVSPATSAASYTALLQQVCQLTSNLDNIVPAQTRVFVVPGNDKAAHATRFQQGSSAADSMTWHTVAAGPSLDPAPTHSGVCEIHSGRMVWPISASIDSSGNLSNAPCLLCRGELVGCVMLKQDETGSMNQGEAGGTQKGEVLSVGSVHFPLIPERADVWACVMVPVKWPWKVLFVEGVVDAPEGLASVEHMARVQLKNRPHQEGLHPLRFIWECANKSKLFSALRNENALPPSGMKDAECSQVAAARWSRSTPWVEVDLDDKGLLWLEDLREAGMQTLSGQLSKQLPQHSAIVVAVKSGEKGTWLCITPTGVSTTEDAGARVVLADGNFGQGDVPLVEGLVARHSGYESDTEDEGADAEKPETVVRVANHSASLGIKHDVSWSHPPVFDDDDNVVGETHTNHSAGGHRFTIPLISALTCNVFWEKNK